MGSEKLQKHLAYKREARRKYAAKFPEKVKARILLGEAVRMGFIRRPGESRNWHNKFEFHHPDHSRPYYGVWLTPKDHRLVDLGRKDCPPCVDYADYVKSMLLKKWGLE